MDRPRDCRRSFPDWSIRASIQWIATRLPFSPFDTPEFSRVFLFCKSFCLPREKRKRKKAFSLRLGVNKSFKKKKSYCNVHLVNVENQAFDLNRRRIDHWKWNCMYNFNKGTSKIVESCEISRIFDVLADYFELNNCEQSWWYRIEYSNGSPMAIVQMALRYIAFRYRTAVTLFISGGVRTLRKHEPEQPTVVYLPLSSLSLSLFASSLHGNVHNVMSTVAQW